MIELSGLNVAGLYLCLKDNEAVLDKRMRELTEDIEAYLYDRLSIEEMEEISKLYKAEDQELEAKI